MKHRGFTLIELSIVLVIIGLITGGILLGRDLIEAAQVRAQVSQIVELKTAINTFKTKYNALPGDILSTNAIAFGMQTRSGARGSGNNDGRVESYNLELSYEVLGGETALFWRDLAFANLIAGDFSNNIDGAVQVPAGQQAQYLPVAKISPKNFLAVFNSEGLGCKQLGLCFALRVINSTNISGTYSVGDNGISPIQAFAIDSKIDDGMPDRGRLSGGNGIPGFFYSAWLVVFPYVPPPAINPCLVSDGGTGFLYRTTGSAASVLACAINFNL